MLAKFTKYLILFWISEEPPMMVTSIYFGVNIVLYKLMQWNGNQKLLLSIDLQLSCN